MTDIATALRAVNYIYSARTTQLEAWRPRPRATEVVAGPDIMPLIQNGNAMSIAANQAQLAQRAFCVTESAQR